MKNNLKKKESEAGTRITTARRRRYDSHVATL